MYNYTMRGLCKFNLHMYNYSLWEVGVNSVYVCTITHSMRLV